QFTLYADTRRGRRPRFTGAAAPELEERLYVRFAATLRARRVEVAPARVRAAGARCRGRPRGVRRGDGGRAGERRAVHDLARHGGALRPDVTEGRALPTRIRIVADKANHLGRRMGRCAWAQ